VTYSIVARDAVSGQIGIAVQSHALAVGRSVPWVEAGVGAVATQALTNSAFGPDGLELLRQARTPDDVISTLLAGDGRPEVRQVAVIDRHGRTAAATGPACVPFAGHRAGAGYSVQGNMLASDECVVAMAEQYVEATAAGQPFSERLLQVLEAAEATGGDVRGRQSAAILVANPNPEPRPWRGVVLDVRLVDHPDPLVELRRLVNLSEAHALLDDEVADTSRPRIERYREAMSRAPEADGLAFRIAVELANQGELEDARREMAVAVAANSRWRETLRRYDRAGRITNEATRAALLAEFVAAVDPAAAEPSTEARKDRARW
jgi:uncharacterized Ntn-hydrolase superfamily protein